MIGGWNWKDEDNNSSANSTVYKTTELQSVGGENGETKKSESVVSSLWKERLPPPPRRPPRSEEGRGRELEEGSRASPLKRRGRGRKRNREGIVWSKRQSEESREKG